MCSEFLRSFEVRSQVHFAVVGHSWDLDSETKWYETCSDKPDGNWDRTAESPMHPVPLKEEIKESKEMTIIPPTSTKNEGNIELLLRTAISVISSASTELLQICAKN